MFRYQTLLTLLTSLTLLTGCSQDLQQRLAPDPKLKEKQTSSQTKKQQEKPESQQQQTRTSSKLNDQVPDSIPFYPEAQLMQQDIDPKAETGKIEWLAQASVDDIQTFYQEKLSGENWEIVTPFSDSRSSNKSQMEARSRNLQLKVVITKTNKDQQGNEVLVAYQPIASTEKSSSNQKETAGQNQTDESAQSKPEKSSAKSEKTVKPTTEFNGKFSDLNETPDALQNYVKDMAKLGILTPSNPQEVKAAKAAEFDPNQPISRATFAHWLLKANNKFYRDDRGKQVDPASKADATTFQDISQSDPGFSAIQGLAEAGIIPSTLGDEKNDNRFRPEEPLTRETLLRWKVPLDFRRSLPSATVEKVKKTWGFQDAGKINKKALSAIMADYKNGEHSNIQRVYGYTQILQPQKPVTRAEAAAALWSFGSGEEVITAQELLQEKDSNGES